MSLANDMLNIQNSGRAESSASSQTIDVGTPRLPTGWATAEIRYHNFPQLPTKKGESVDSAPFSCHGLDWYLRIHPGGASSAKGDNMVSLYLRCKSAAERNIAVQAEFSLALLRTDGNIDSMMSCPCNAFRRKRKGWPNFIDRARVLDQQSRLLLDSQGTLTVIVKIQMFQEKDTNFVPRNHLNLVKLLKEANTPPKSKAVDNEGDAEVSNTVNTADAKISVEGEVFHAHRLILKLAAPALAHLCEDADDDECIIIPGVRSPIFQGVLRFAYGDAVPEEIWKVKGGVATRHGMNPAMELLDAANRFGVVGLKILAETKVAEFVSVATASDLILYADAKNCALLKERVVDFFVVHAEEIRKHPSFHKVKESARILDELMEAVVSKRTLRSFPLGEDDIDYDSMGVNLLRRKLDAKGLDVDGSREMLIQRLERKGKKVTGMS